MHSIIKLLSDSVANQIAAGEVVQRPASVVKELLENALDAGATQVKLLVRDAGSTLVQVIDNGKGMSETDARLCWERHATSKIRKADDLFGLKSFGFRGEALASIASVAQVEMRTRRIEDSAASKIRIEASRIVEEGSDSAPVGTSISVKNLFYNIPARRNFLKSPSVEFKHIVEEFQRQALGAESVHFQLYNNDQLLHDYPAETKQKRFASLLGKSMADILLPVLEETEIVHIEGFVCKPEAAKKTRGDQYWFVNGRYFKSAYLHHALMAAYESLLPADSFPAYCLYLSVDPAKIDVNVHPTKTEIKFEDEKHIYNLIKAAVRKALGLYVVQPQSAEPEASGWTDFLSPGRSIPSSNPDWGKLGKSESPSASRYNPFPAGGYERKSHQDWQKILGPVDEEIQAARLYEPTAAASEKPLQLLPADAETLAWVQVLNERYWVFSFHGELRILDRRLAQQKVLFHQYVEYLEKGSSPTQQSLFPRTLEFSAGQMAVLLDLMDPLKAMGFDLGHFGGQTLLVNGVPALLSGCDEQATLEKILEDYQNTQGDVKLSHTQSLALAMARSAARMAAVETQESERLHLVQRLMNLEQPQFGIDGRPVYIRVGPEQITDLFKKHRNT